jgi:putative DNA-invertase from lambdoid prophage Rac
LNGFWLMPRVFVYARVSTLGQTAENQLGEVRAAGFDVQPRRIITETISGGTPAEQRPAFRKLLDRLESDDVLVVTKLDRLGRNAMDVRTTVDRLAALGVRVHCLALGGADLTSSAGKMTMQVIAAVAEFERDLLVERTQSGLVRARQQGKALGRPATLTPVQRQAVAARLDAGESCAAIARELGTSRMTIMRTRSPVSSPAERDVP